LNQSTTPYEPIAFFYFAIARNDFAGRQRGVTHALERVRYLKTPLQLAE
jgi:hypothetical protein